MDALLKLKIEWPRINKLINQFNPSSAAANASQQLGKVLESGDKDTIIYCVDTIVKWYSENFQKIMGNEFCYDKGEHARNKQFLEEMQGALNSYAFPCVPEFPLIDEDKEPLIFLSHKSDDRKYGDALSEFILGLGVKRNQLIYTSSPLHKIPLDKNIYEYLRIHINRRVFMIILWSDAYLESPSCLNEMGAAWVTQCDYTNMYTPNFNFGNPKYHECAIDTKKMGAVLRNDKYCKASMLEFKKKILALFQLPDDDVQNSLLLDRFMNAIDDA